MAGCKKTIRVWEKKKKTTEILLKLVTRTRQTDQMFLQGRQLCGKTAGQAGPHYSWHLQFRGFHNVFGGASLFMLVMTREAGAFLGANTVGLGSDIAVATPCRCSAHKCCSAVRPPARADQVTVFL